MIPGLDQVNDLNFTWNVTKQNTEELEVHLYFANPELVSTGSTPDEMVLTFNEPLLFLGVNGLMISSETRVLRRTLLKQISMEAGEKI